MFLILLFMSLQVQLTVISVLIMHVDKPCQGALCIIHESCIILFSLVLLERIWHEISCRNGENKMEIVFVHHAVMYCLLLCYCFSSLLLRENKAAGFVIKLLMLCNFLPFRGVAPVHPHK